MKNLSLAVRNAVPSRGPLREDVRAFKREMILNAAIEVFYEKGYMNSTVDDIAAAMSVSKAVVYYNFKSKEDVLEFAVDRSLELTHRNIDRGLELGKTPAQKLALACFFYASHILANQKLIALFFREERNCSPSLRRRTASRGKAVDDKIVGVLDAGVAIGAFRPMDTELMAETILGMISMAFDWYRDRGRARAQQICRHFSEQALRLAGFTGELGVDEAAFTLAADES